MSLPVFERTCPVVAWPWERVLAWGRGRIVRKWPPKVVPPFTASTQWIEVAGSGVDEGLPGWVRRDKLEAIRALKPSSIVEVVSPLHGRPYLRVSWTAATGRQAWLSFVLEHPASHELARFDANAARSALVEARAATKARRQAALEAEGVASESDESEAA